jgi:hypothetical protein
MTEENFEKFRDNAVLVIFIFASLTLSTAFIVEIFREPINRPKFQAVDKYKGCDVIRYTTPDNDYQYLLDCSPKSTKP